VIARPAWRPTWSFLPGSCHRVDVLEGDTTVVGDSFKPDTNACTSLLRMLPDGRFPNSRRA
jgi:hypothetical protein